MKKTATFEIKNKLRILNLLITFIILTLCFVIIRYLNGPFYQILNFIPDTSMVAISIIAVLLVAVGLYLLRMLSGQVVNKIEDYSDKLDSILNITRDLREEIHGDILLQKIMDCSLTITGSDIGSILLVDDDNLVFKTTSGAAVQGLLGKTVPKDSGVAGAVLMTGEPVLIADMKKSGKLAAQTDEFKALQPDTVLCVPLKTKSAVIGVVELMNKRKEPFNEKDVELISYLADQAAISIEKAKFYDDQRNYEIQLTEILLASMDRFMSEKRGHSKRVARYANIIAKALNMSEEKRRRLYFASLLHDIGFLKIEADRFYDMKAYSLHPVIGYEILNQISFYRDVARYVLYHHERYDGQGYPERLKGDAIPLEARIIAIAEAFDAMVSEFSYKVAVNFDVAIEELNRTKGGQFDPELVDLFVRDVKEPLN